MTHPKSRQERRVARELYIQKRKFIQTRIWYTKTTYWRSAEDEGRVPYDHETYDLRKYNEYVEWQALSNDDKKIKQVEAVLDRKEFVEPKWEPTQWGRFSKNNLTCNCCHCDRCEKRPVRSIERSKAVKDSIG